MPSRVAFARDVYLAHGRALLRVGIGNANDAEMARLLRSAATELGFAEERGLAGLARDARHVLDPASGNITNELERIATVAANASGLGVDDACLVLRRFAEMLDSAGVSDLRGWTRVIDGFDAMAVAEGQVSELAPTRLRLAERAAEWCLTVEPSDGAAKLAARTLPLLGDARPDLHAHLAEQQHRLPEAIRFFREAGLPAEALRVSRHVGTEPRLVVELAREAGAVDTPSLERLARVHEELSALDVSTLTIGERDHLERAFRSRLGIRKR